MTAALRSAAAAAASLSDRASARLSGWIDFDAYRRAEPLAVDRSLPTSIKLSAPGFALELEPASVDWHADERAIVLLTGQPTLCGMPATAAKIAAALDGAALQAASVGGRFSLVLIDLARRVVSLQTDRFGIWPLCWSRNGERLSFSDRADGVPARERPSVDPQALFDYVYFHMIPAPRTVFRGVSRLEPATELRFDGSNVRLAQVWHPRFSDHRQGTLDDLSSGFRRAIQEGVAAEVGCGQVGCFLSGGTDSSTVAGTLKAVTGRAATFSIGFDQRGYDEMEYARIAAKHFGTEHHEHYVTPPQLVAAIPRVGAYYDQPFGNSSAVPAFICARLAREHGVTKLLAGDGGDELFGGNSRYAKQKIFEAWWAVPRSARNAIAPLIANGVTRGVPLFRKAASYVDQASVPMPERLETYNLLRRFGATSVFTNDFLRLVDQQQPASLQTEIYARQHSASFVDRMLAYDWRFTLADNDLPKVAGTCRLAGVDVGFPLLSDLLVDIAMRLAPRDKVRGLRLRHFFKDALTGFLPPEIITKKKHGFGLPVGMWLVSDAAFRGLARDSVVALSERQIIRRDFADDLFSQRLEEHAAYYGEMIWVLMMMEQWLAARAPTWTFH